MVWTLSEGILVERIEYDELFTDEMVSKACKFYFNNFLPSVVPSTTISTSYAIPLHRPAGNVCTGNR